jgi:hypothetical protein
MSEDGLIERMNRALFKMSFASNLGVSRSPATNNKNAPTLTAR